MELRADSYFAIVPDWVLRVGLSDKALRLYTELSLRCDYDSRECRIGRKKLAALLGCSVDTVDRLKKELEDKQALTIGREQNAANVYLVHRLPVAARVRPGEPQAVAAGVAAPGAAHVQTQDDQSLSLLAEPGESLPSGWPLGEVAKKPVTRGEALLAMEVMTKFNAIAGTRFRAPEFYKGIVGRIREHPELTVEQHEAIIRRVLQDPWWKGDAAPNVIYGNGAVFERALNGRQDNRRAELDAYGRE